MTPPCRGSRSLVSEQEPGERGLWSDLTMDFKRDFRIVPTKKQDCPRQRPTIMIELWSRKKTGNLLSVKRKGQYLQAAVTGIEMCRKKQLKVGFATKQNDGEYNKEISK